jgi:hypothetical protein
VVQLSRKQKKIERCVGNENRDGVAMKKNISVVLLICVTLVGTSCGNTPAATDDIGREQPVAPDAAPGATDDGPGRSIPFPETDDSDSSGEANDIAVQIVYDVAFLNLDKSAEQIMENMSQFGYNWSLEYEFIDGGDLETYHVLSDIDGSSVCTVFGTYLYDLLPKEHPKDVTTIQDLEAFWGKKAKDPLASADDYGCYTFDFGEITVQVSADKYGAVDFNFPNAAVYKPQGEFIDAISFVRALIQKERTTFAIRRGVLAEAFDQYISVLGTPLDMIAQRMTPLGEDEYYGLKFEAGGVEYRVHSDIELRQTCDVIIGPAGNILSNIEETIDTAYLKSLGLAFSWDYFDGYRYWYSFDDAYVYMESDSAGVVGQNDSVVIKPW